MNQDRWVTLAKFGKAHGVRGYVRLYPYTDRKDALTQYKPLYLSNIEGNGPIEFDDIIVKDQYCLVKPKGCQNKDHANLYTHALIQVHREALPVSQDVYLTDLEGMLVYDEEQRYYGKVAWILETGANDVLMVKSDDRQWLVPYVKDLYIKHIDHEKRSITIDAVCIVDDEEALA